MKLIGLTGLPRCGKDTFAERLVGHHGYVRRAFATPLKAAAAILLGREVWEMEGQQGFDRDAILPEWGFSTRDFLQKLGTECLRNQIRQDFWIKKMLNSMRMSDSIVITDVRFTNEAKLVRDLGGTIIGIARPGLVRSSHVSDAPIAADAIVLNDAGINELWAEADAYA